MGTGGTALHLLASEQEGEPNSEVAELLLAHPDTGVNIARSDGTTALWLAAFVGNEALARILLSRNDTDVNKSKEDDATPLYAAAEKGFPGIVKLLLAHPEIDVNKARAEDGITPLHAASYAGRQYNRLKWPQKGSSARARYTYTRTVCV